MVESLNRCIGHSRGLKRNCAFSRTKLLVVIGVVFLAIFMLGLLDGGAARAREKARRAQCIINLQRVALARRLLEGDHPGLARTATNQAGSVELASGMNVAGLWRAMSDQLATPRILVCPSDDRTSAADFAHLTTANISYFLGLDLDDAFPGMLLAGDRNLTTNGVPIATGFVAIGTNVSLGFRPTMHHAVGNIALADGSVQLVKAGGLQQLAARSGTNVIRLAMP